MRKWKRKNILNNYFNCLGSSDLISIENCWQGSKQWLKTVSHWDDETTEHLSTEGWKEYVPQRFINERSRNMSQHLKDVIALEGQLTGYWRVESVYIVYNRWNVECAYKFGGVPRFGNSVRIILLTAWWGWDK